MEPTTLNRRQFLAGLAASGLPALPYVKQARVQAPSALRANPLVLCIFSKHLHWVPVDDLGDAAASLGFTGVDLTVRRGGHVEPERVKTDLPLAVKRIQQAGLQVPMIVTDIIDADHPLTEVTLQTAASLGIRHYRTAYFKYDPALEISPSLDRFRKQLQKLALLNQQYGIQGAYQNHAGVTHVGAAVWDLWALLKDLDPRWMGCQYDIKHAVAEGGLSWENGLRALKSHIPCLDIKDFIWAKTDGKWQQQSVPLGTGMVNYPHYFSLLKQYGIRGPMSVHFEYPLGGADTGKKQLTISRDEVRMAMQRDLKTLKQWLLEASF